MYHNFDSECFCKLFGFDAAEWHHLKTTTPLEQRDLEERGPLCTHSNLTETKYDPIEYGDEWDNDDYDDDSESELPLFSNVF